MTWPGMLAVLWCAAASVLISWKGENVILAAILGITIVAHKHMDKILDVYGKANKQKPPKHSIAQEG